VWCDFALREFPHTAAKVLLFLGEAEFHGLSGATICSRYTQPKYNLYHRSQLPKISRYPDVLVSQLFHSPKIAISSSPLSPLW
jgi:hypothetical protein